MRTWYPGISGPPVSRRWWWPVAMLCGMLLAAGPLGAQQVAKMEAATAHEKALKGEILLVDIRTPEEWKQTGVPATAHAITMHQNGQLFLSALLNAAGGNSKMPVAVICRTGSRSTALAGPLLKAGFPNVINVEEGVVGGPRGTGWIKRGLPGRLEVNRVGQHQTCQWRDNPWPNQLRYALFALLQHPIVDQLAGSFGVPAEIQHPHPGPLSLIHI